MAGHLWGSQTLPMIDEWVNQWPDNGFCHFWHFGDVCRDFLDAPDEADADNDDDDDDDDIDNKDDNDW